MSPSYIHFSSTPEIRIALKQALESLDEYGSTPGHASQATKSQKLSDTATEPRPPVTDAHASPADNPLSVPKAIADEGPELLLAQRAALLSLANSKDGDPVPYRLIRAASCFLKSKGSKSRAKQARGPLLQTVLKGSSLHLPSPPARHKSPELLARLERLQDELETREYNDIVKDVDRTAGGMPDPFMATFKQQAAFGINVVSLMATGYVVGHFAMAALARHSKHLHPVGGIVGLIIAMMVEVLLYAIIADRAEQKQRRNELKRRRFATASEVASRAAQQKWANEHSPEITSQPESVGQGASEGLRRRR